MAQSLTLHSGILYGFERLHVFLYTGSTPEYFVIEGKAGEGGTQKLEIEGLSKEPTTVAASDITYYLARKGVGKVTANLTLLDVPFERENLMLGRKTTTDGTSLIGKETEAPEAAFIAESHLDDGTPVYISVLRGVFRREKTGADSIDPDEEFKPEGAEYVFTAQTLISDDKDFNGNTVATHIGDDAGKEHLFTVLGFEKPTIPAAPAK
ncbi:major tail protein [Weissella minor]|uniref:Phage major tail protein n=1 Tax=Weissella minor TaxID=1620 RepID=A0A0R2JK14_9LACO|nr:major tail protein [Weissella minor]KRN77586.1 hypothetical protein IV67_GL001429 [Weissella minor]